MVTFYMTNEGNNCCILKRKSLIKAKLVKSAITIVITRHKIIVINRRIMRKKKAILLCYAIRRTRHIRIRNHLFLDNIVHFLNFLPLTLVPSILKPNLHLCRCQFQALCHLFSFGCRKVFLLLEATLQLKNLCLRKKHSGFPFGPLSSRFTKFCLRTGHLLVF